MIIFLKNTILKTQKVTSPSKAIIKKTKKAICKKLYSGDENAMRLDNDDILPFHHENSNFTRIKSVIGSNFCEESADDFKSVLIKFIDSDLANRVELENAKLYLNEGIFR